MLEIMNASGGGSDGTFFPDSGPGPKTLLSGNAVDGYFGQVTTDQLFTYAEIEAEITKMTGTKLVPTDLTWHKFIIDNKVLFTANRAFRNTTWNAVYQAGYIYGTDDNGKFPTATPVYQRPVLFKKEPNGKTSGLVLRTHTHSPIDPVNGESMNLGDWVRTTAALFNGRYPPRPTYAQMDGTNGEWMQNTFSGGTGSAWWRSYNGGTASAKNSTYYWRPVLELINQKENVLPVEFAGYKNGYTYVGTTATAIVTDDKVLSVVVSETHSMKVSEYPNGVTATPGITDVVKVQIPYAASQAPAEFLTTASIVN